MVNYVLPKRLMKVSRNCGELEPPNYLPHVLSDCAALLDIKFLNVHTYILYFIYHIHEIIFHCQFIVELNMSF